MPLLLLDVRGSREALGRLSGSARGCAGHWRPGFSRRWAERRRRRQSAARGGVAVAENRMHGREQEQMRRHPTSRSQLLSRSQRRLRSLSMWSGKPPSCPGRRAWTGEEGDGGGKQEQQVGEQVVAGVRSGPCHAHPKLAAGEVDATHKLQDGSHAGGAPGAGSGAGSRAGSGENRARRGEVCVERGENFPSAGGGLGAVHGQRRGRAQVGMRGRGVWADCCWGGAGLWMGGGAEGRAAASLVVPLLISTSCSLAAAPATPRSDSLELQSRFLRLWERRMVVLDDEKLIFVKPPRTVGQCFGEVEGRWGLATTTSTASNTARAQEVPGCMRRVWCLMVVRVS